MSIHLKNVRIKYINQKRQNIHVRGGKVKPPIPYLHGLIMGDVSIRFEEKIKKYRVLSIDFYDSPLNGESFHTCISAI